MVRHNIIRFISIVALGSQLTACGFIRTIWGEKAPPRKTVTVESTALPEITDFFSDNEAVAQDVFNKYTNSILEAFDKIEGREKNRLSIDEIMSLARAGLAKLSDKQSVSLARIKSALTLLGYKNGISRHQLEELFQWAREHRLKGKTFYNFFIKNKDEKFTSEILIDLVEFIGSLISKGGKDVLTNKQIQEIINPWIPENYTHATKALPEGIDLVFSFFNSLCGDRVDADRWNAYKNGQCLVDLIDWFRPTKSVFNFMFNRLNPITERDKLIESNRVLVEKVEGWIKDHKHPNFQTQKVASFSEQLEIPSPYNFFRLTEWLKKLNKDSDEKNFSPTFFIDIAKVLQNWVATFTEATKNTKESDRCSFAEWRKCNFQGEYETSERLFNDEYATLIRENNLDFIYKISFYDSIADYLINALDDDHDGVLHDNIKDLISVGVGLLDSNAFAQNVILRLQEKPIAVSNTEKSIANIRRQGLAEVAALAADLIPDRGGGRRNLLKKLTAQIYDSEKFPSYTLDRLGITTFIYVFDLIGTLRTQYMADYDFAPVKDGTNIWIKRKRVVELLPRMLYDHFPRIYNECLDWGFERTCGVVFTEVLASPVKDTVVLEPSDLDIITLTSILLESMMNRCDRNHDDVLSTNLLDGFDEKHCVLTVSRTLANRLMNANILENDSKTRTLLKIMKWIAPARWAAKVALERGTMKNIGIRAVPIISLVSGPAKLGGVMSLTAEFMDPEKVDAIEAGVEGHHEDAGDELIYLNQLTDKYLPSKQWALRTSDAARILYGPSKTTPGSE